MKNSFKRLKIKQILILGQSFRYPQAESLFETKAELGVTSSGKFNAGGFSQWASIFTP
jgi:hypothetical protein